MKRLFALMLFFLMIFCSCAVEHPAENKESISGESDTLAEISEHKETPESITETEIDTESSEVNEPSLSPEDILNRMTLEEKVGQLFLVRNPKDTEEGERLIKKLHIGGIIFFGRDFKSSSPSAFTSLTRHYEELAKIPLLTAVDEEGGTVCRVSQYSAFRGERFPSPAELYERGGFDAISEDAIEKSQLLLSIGLNLNLAPVADISTDENDFIHERALGLGAKETSEYVSIAVGTMKECGILSALKHFPGYGNNEDTHTGIAYDKRSLEYLRENDLLPFAAGIEAGAPIIMISHNIVECLDAEKPASLSRASVALLRDELDFDGVIMTDDLSMDAIKDFTDSGSAAVMAITAGCDLLCCSDPEAQYYAVLSAVKNGEIGEERLNDAVIRILGMKFDYGFFE